MLKERERERERPISLAVPICLFLTPLNGTSHSSCKVRLLLVPSISNSITVQRPHVVSGHPHIMEVRGHPLPMLQIRKLRLRALRKRPADDAECLVPLFPSRALSPRKNPLCFASWQMGPLVWV